MIAFCNDKIGYEWVKFSSEIGDQSKNYITLWSSRNIRLGNFRLQQLFLDQYESLLKSKLPSNLADLDFIFNCSEAVIFFCHYNAISSRTGSPLLMILTLAWRKWSFDWNDHPIVYKTWPLKKTPFFDWLCFLCLALQIMYGNYILK